MNAFRITLSLFVVILIAVSVAGWIWTGVHQTRAEAAGSHIVLGMSLFTGVVGLVALWRPRPEEPLHGRS